MARDSWLSSSGWNTCPVRATRGILIGLLVSLAGCGGHQTQTSANYSGAARIARPAKPLWCPMNVPGSSDLRRERFDVRTLLGLARGQAEATAAQHGCKSRVVKIDGHTLIVTSDYDISRVDLTLQRNIVTAVDVG